LCLHGYCCYLVSLLVHWNHQGTLDKFSKAVRKKIAWRTLSLVSMDAKLKVVGSETNPQKYCLLAQSSFSPVSMHWICNRILSWITLDLSFLWWNCVEEGPIANL
jgi:hypothetical protein